MATKHDMLLKGLIAGGVTAATVAPAAPVEIYTCDQYKSADYRCDPYSPGDPRDPGHPGGAHATVTGSTSAVAITQAPPGGNVLGGEAIDTAQGNLSPGITAGLIANVEPVPYSQEG